MLRDLEINDDFSRDVWCFFGLIFDNSTIRDVIEALDKNIASGRQLVLATPNLNWIILAYMDPLFRRDVLMGDMSVMDGMPLLWVANMLKIPAKEKISGSTLIEEMRSRSSSNKQSIFFFGGRDGVAKSAHENLKSGDRGLISVGFCYPGHGTIMDMSGDEVFGQINGASPDILLVALGAKKGVRWIELNKTRLNVKVLSHVGAAVDFIAGTIKRAPKWMQNSGLEWIWRIIQQPVLAGRYLRDGIVFIWLFLTRIIPYKLFLTKCGSGKLRGEKPIVDIRETQDRLIISVKGSICHGRDEAARERFKTAAKADKDVYVDFSGVEYIDSSFLGLLLLLYKWQKINEKNLVFTDLTETVKRIFKYNLVDDIFITEV